MSIAELIHNSKPNLEIQVNTAGGSFKSQFKKADKSGARVALVLGEDEMDKQQISIKDLRNGTDQISVDPCISFASTRRGRCGPMIYTMRREEKKRNV